MGQDRFVHFRSLYDVNGDELNVFTCKDCGAAVMDGGNIGLERSLHDMWHEAQEQAKKIIAMPKKKGCARHGESTHHEGSLGEFCNYCNGPVD